MINIKSTILSFISLCSFCFSGVEDHLISTEEINLNQTSHLEGWLDDFAEAKKIASEKKCPLLIAFLGPTWCPWSDKLEAEVLVNQNFFKNLQTEVVFLKVDIPEDFDRHTKESLPALKLKEQYFVDECPTLVLVTPNGKQIAKLNYLPISCSAFASYIKEMLTDYEKLSLLTEKKALKKLDGKELKSLYAKAGRLADETFKKVLLNQGIKTDPSPYFLLEQYGVLLTKGKGNSWASRRLRNKILSLDPKNKNGSHRKLAVMDFNALAVSAKTDQKMDAVIHPLVDYLQKFGSKDLENAWRIEMMISQYLFGKDQIGASLIHAKNSLKIAPEPAQKEIVQSIEYLQTQLKAK